MSYVQYLEDYAPVYYKYMQEWDALCLKKDKAYIDLYGGQPMEAYNQSQEILKEYPTNREALLLKGLSLIQMSSEVGNLGTLSSSMEYDLSQSLRGADEAIALADSVLAGVATERSAPDERTELQMEAEATLDHYRCHTAEVLLRHILGV